MARLRQMTVAAMASERKHLLFVYGTLRRGQPAHALLAEAQFVAATRTAQHYALLDLSAVIGPFPALVLGTQAVQGELYRCSSAVVAAIDIYEDCPTDYRRLPVSLADGGLAESYLWQRAEVGRVVVSGNWCAL